MFIPEFVCGLIVGAAGATAAIFTAAILYQKKKK